MIDPIDGTANFLRGMPYWSVALAYVTDDRVEIGVTYDPVHDELFWARRGGGAHRDHAPIRVSGATDPQRAVVGSTYTFKMRIERYVALVEGILRAGSDHRRMGSTALMMCHVADGRLDGCVTGYCNSWDVIGGLFLVRRRAASPATSSPRTACSRPAARSPCTPGLRRRSSRCAAAQLDS